MKMIIRTNIIPKSAKSLGGFPMSLSFQMTNTFMHPRSRSGLMTQSFTRTKTSELLGKSKCWLGGANYSSTNFIDYIANS